MLGFDLQAAAQVPGNVIGRVFEVKFNREVGTAFIVDYKDRQYIVTANHIVIGAGNRPLSTFGHQPTLSGTALKLPFFTVPMRAQMLPSWFHP